MTCSRTDSGFCNLTAPALHVIPAVLCCFWRYRLHSTSRTSATDTRSKFSRKPTGVVDFRHASELTQNLLEVHSRAYTCRARKFLKVKLTRQFLEKSEKVVQVLQGWNTLPRDQPQVVTCIPTRNWLQVVARGWRGSRQCRLQRVSLADMGVVGRNRLFDECTTIQLTSGV